MCTVSTAVYSTLYLDQLLLSVNVKFSVNVITASNM